MQKEPRCGMALKLKADNLTKLCHFVLLKHNSIISVFTLHQRKKL